MHLFIKHHISLIDTTQWHLAVSAAAECIKSGGIVAVPTDTLYGLCTLAEYADRLYKLKKRPSEKPLGLIINEPEQITKYVLFNYTYFCKKAILGNYGGPKYLQ